MVPEAATGETCKGGWKRVQWESPGLFRSNTVEARHRSTGPPRRCSKSRARSAPFIAC
uniref:Uncharacterized protein n=2 Tax=Mus TaxID=862507 RepID=Q3TYI7_MOUSE|nr:unnamed protein product [Mus musculus]